jgi:hypothetical protein
MATAKQILGAVNRAADFAMTCEQDDPDQRAANFVTHFCGAMRALEVPAVVSSLNRLLGIETGQPVDGA